jgi:hypothetical protein
VCGSILEFKKKEVTPSARTEPNDVAGVGVARGRLHDVAGGVGIAGGRQQDVTTGGFRQDVTNTDRLGGRRQDIANADRAGGRRKTSRQ